MRKIILSNDKKFFKANLNCKTNNSFGKLTAEQLKDLYKSKGYSIIAFCDKKPVSYKNLCDDDFLVISSYSTQIENYSLSLYSENSGEVYAVENENNDNYDIQENLTAFISKANQKGFLVSLNHPCKSMLTYHDLENTKGLFGIEIANFSSFVEGNYEDNNHIYDRILRSHFPAPFPIACDGNKNLYSIENENNDSFGAFIYIYSDDLSYESVISALKKGDFYASTGPTFEEIYIEDGKIHIKCSPVRSIRLLNEGRDAPIAIANDGELINEAVFDIDPNFCGKLIRVDIRDDNGNFADTVPYYLGKL
ncbi:MAG: hypothetical protein E7562_03625 [Ruminococcaceae bacterium]|nr:hypothetical protein [Oscillospiraceae bacterium]